MNKIWLIGILVIAFGVFETEEVNAALCTGAGQHGECASGDGARCSGEQMQDCIQNYNPYDGTFYCWTEGPSCVPELVGYPGGGNCRTCSFGSGAQAACDTDNDGSVGTCDCDDDPRDDPTGCSLTASTCTASTSGCAVCASSNLNYYYDNDGDDYYSFKQFSCHPPTDPKWKTTTLGEDCDDNDVTVNPSITEADATCFDGKDNNCNNKTDCMDTSACPAYVPDTSDFTDPVSGTGPKFYGISGGVSYYRACCGMIPTLLIWRYNDIDSDGVGDSSEKKYFCPGSVPADFVTTGGDCDPSDINKWQNLQGCFDGDNDGYGTGSLGDVCSGAVLLTGYSDVCGDCDDLNSAIKPGVVDPYNICRKCSSAGTGWEFNDGTTKAKDGDCYYCDETTMSKKINGYLEGYAKGDGDCVFCNGVSGGLTKDPIYEGDSLPNDDCKICSGLNTKVSYLENMPNDGDCMQCKTPAYGGDLVISPDPTDNIVLTNPAYKCKQCLGTYLADKADGDSCLIANGECCKGTCADSSKNYCCSTGPKLKGTNCDCNACGDKCLKVDLCTPGNGQCRHKFSVLGPFFSTYQCVECLSAYGNTAGATLECDSGSSGFNYKCVSNVCVKQTTGGSLGGIAKWILSLIVPGVDMANANEICNSKVPKLSCSQIVISATTICLGYSSAGVCINAMVDCFAEIDSSIVLPPSCSASECPKAPVDTCPS